MKFRKAKKEVLKLFDHFEIFRKKAFDGCKSQIFVIGYRIAIGYLLLDIELLSDVA